MKLGNNIHGGQRSWSTKAIREEAAFGGGVPPGEIAVIADNGDCVLWTCDGEVFTVQKMPIILEVA